MDTKEYRTRISDPWRWHFQSFRLFLAAKDLCDLYHERLEATRKNDKKRLNAGNKQLKKELEQTKADWEEYRKELEQVKAGKKSFLDLKPIEPHYSCYRTTVSCEDLNINSKAYYHLLPVYMMVMGMAVENLAKGIKVARKLKEDNTIVSRATLKEFGIFGHTAPDLIEDLSIEYLKDEKELLYDINEYLLWKGRYSAPSNENKPDSTGITDNMTIVELDEENVFGVFAGLYMRLEDIFIMETKGVK